MDPLEDFMREFQKEIEEYIAQTWDVNDEVTETGSIITRARMKGHPMEVINAETGVFQLNMN